MSSIEIGAYYKIRGSLARVACDRDQVRLDALALLLRLLESEALGKPGLHVS
jgi:hypothetical protein